MDGIIPSSLITDEWRQAYLEVLKEVRDEAVVRMRQEQSDEEEEDDEKEEEEVVDIPLCHELGLFLKYANGIQDPDFRSSGICPFEPVPAVGITEYAFSERANLEDYILDKANVDAYVDEDPDVKVGFLTGTGWRAQHDEWYSAYLYYHQEEDSRSPDPSLKDWAWRVCVFHAGLENSTALYGQYPRFNSLPEFLDWYSSWLEFVDMKVVKKNVRRHWGDDDYDSDME
ncbi:uncharacterized protein N7473_001401 [Penicillium subrubescens]|uniref:Uncharacterized protein n=1 Tax=Penicillium subrubescens TaxID=1316194 RepID=A0A1Q5T8K5_9EURO|nr:uncharacterized protein N7473_001401 [Penicillium subrubescens]KAJ5912098.1 hypothetical protein N7473_001401 [Penicillium subrubescens]OKO96563.1 hypothetical protein PENSUB_10738 [Penicillium subrubescens]